MAGIRAFSEHGVAVSLSAVVLRSTEHGLSYLAQIADCLDAGKLKLIMPLRKGNALDLDEGEFLTPREAKNVFDRLSGCARAFGWRPALRLTAWTPETEGHMICVEPDGRANAGRPQVIDTRYDTDHLLGRASRRLVDVCGELGLDVTQPELRGTSMTALHREWLTTATVQARERISVLNLRHSLSTALVAMRAVGAADGRLCNVNRILAANLGGTFGWLEHPSFTALLDTRH